MAYPQPHPRLSVISTSSLPTEYYSPTTSTARFAAPTQSINNVLSNANSKTNARYNIYDRNLNKTRVAEVSLSAYAFLFSEIVQYTQKRVNGINDLEKR